jgi:hypothetical protein
LVSFQAITVFVGTDTTESIEERIRVLFCNAKKLKTPERDAEYENIRKDYFKVLDDAGNCHKHLIIL